MKLKALSFLQLAFFPTAMLCQIPAKQKMHELDGNWVVVTAEGDGEAMDHAKGSKFTFAEGKLTMKGKIARSSGGEDHATYSGDTIKKPKTLDLTLLKPSGEKDTVLLGIYHLVGNDLKLCLGLMERPHEFRSKGAMILILKREKKIVPEPGPKEAKLDDQAKQVAEQMLMVLQAKDLKEIVKLADIPWAEWDVREGRIIRDRDELKKALQKTLASRDWSRSKFEHAQTFTYEGFRKLGDKDPVKELLLLDKILDKSDRVVSFVTQTEVWFLMIRLKDKKAAVVSIMAAPAGK